MIEHYKVVAYSQEDASMVSTCLKALECQLLSTTTHRGKPAFIVACDVEKVGSPAQFQSRLDRLGCDASVRPHAIDLGAAGSATVRHPAASGVDSMEMFLDFDIEEINNHYAQISAMIGKQIDAIAPNLGDEQGDVGFQQYSEYLDSVASRLMSMGLSVEDAYEHMYECMLSMVSEGSLEPSPEFDEEDGVPVSDDEYIAWVSLAKHAAFGNVCVQSYGTEYGGM